MRVKYVLKDQSGNQTIQAIGLAILGLIAVALIFNATKGGFSMTSGKVGNVINTVGNNI